MPFPLEKIYAALNAAEPVGLITKYNFWGGSDLIGGSPRMTESQLSVAQVQRTIQRVLDEERR